MADSDYKLSYLGKLEGHSDWVTCLSTTPGLPELLVSGSRDRSLIVWKLAHEADNVGKPLRSLHGHIHYVSDVALSNDGAFALSASWDKTLRLWNLATGESTGQFVGHTKDVTSVAFSPNNRQIVSASRDRTIRIWNTLAECKCVIERESHSDWVSCVRFSPDAEAHLMVSTGWDRQIKVFETSSTNFALMHSMVGHTGVINALAMAPDGSICATGGKDHQVMLWTVKEGQHLYNLDASSEIHALQFSPTEYWLAAATEAGVKIFSLESKKVVAVLSPETEGTVPPPRSVAWSGDGSILYVGYTDGSIHVWRKLAQEDDLVQ